MSGPHHTQHISSNWTDNISSREDTTGKGKTIFQISNVMGSVENYQLHSSKLQKVQWNYLWKIFVFRMKRPWTTSLCPHLWQGLGASCWKMSKFPKSDQDNKEGDFRFLLTLWILSTYEFYNWFILHCRSMIENVIILIFNENVLFCCI